jgi:hypothetical protein
LAAPRGRQPPGVLASTLQPSEAGADLKVVMAYRYLASEDKGAIEVQGWKRSLPRGKPQEGLADPFTPGDLDHRSAATASSPLRWSLVAAAPRRASHEVTVLDLQIFQDALVATARYLAAHSPTVRAQGQTWNGRR